MIDDDVIGRLVDLHDNIQPPVTVPEADVARGRGMLRRRRTLVAGAAAAAVAAVLITVTIGPPRGDPQPVGPDLPIPGPGSNGWVAVATETPESEILLLEPGEEARPLEVPGTDGTSASCPVWSPDGTRLMFGRTGVGSGRPDLAELVVATVDEDGVASDPTTITLEGFEAFEGFDPHPCATWAPDGRWAALAGSGDVWVVDTRNGEIRRLPGFRPSDLEWRPGSDELAIAGDMGDDRGDPTLATAVSVYSVSTGELTSLGSIAAAHLTWSPDGRTLAFTGGEGDESKLWLVDSAGGAPRVLVDPLGSWNHGVGPIWSPAGDRIAYQRLITPAGGESHEVVVIDAADGSETVIDPPVIESGEPEGSAAAWYPWHIAWSPDGEMLLYNAWIRTDDPLGEEQGMIVVPVDTPGDPIILAVEDYSNEVYSHGWTPNQMWGRVPD